MATDAKIAELEGLKDKHKGLERQKMAAEAEIFQHERTRDELVAEMKEKFGVETVEELRALYEKLLEEDNAKISAFREQVDAITGRLEALEDA